MTGRLEKCINLAKKVGLKGKTVLDIGCSDGWFCRVATDEGAKAIYAIEPDPNKIKLAQKNAPKTRVRRGIAGKLNMPKDKFDIVTLFDVIEHVPKNSELQVFKEVSRVLKKNGYLILSTPFDWWLSKIGDAAWYFGHRHYSEEKLTRLLKETGFKIKQFSTHGGFWEIISMWILYISKWIFHIPMPFEQWFDKKRRKEFNQEGKAEIFLIAQKI